MDLITRMLIKNEEKLEYLHDQRNFTDEQLLQKYIMFDPFNVIELRDGQGVYDYFLLDTDLDKAAADIKKYFTYSFKAKQLTGKNAGTVYTLRGLIFSDGNYISKNFKNGIKMRVNFSTNEKICCDRKAHPLVKLYGEVMNMEQLLRVYTYRNRKKFYFDIDCSKAQEWVKKVFESERLKTEGCKLEEGDLECGL